jgi:hypothetical protein
MLGLCIESAINTKNISLLQDSIKQMEIFSIQFLLLSSRDGLKQADHTLRNKELPKSIIFSILHFLYEILETTHEAEFRSAVEDTLYYIFYFLGLLINCLYDKLGRPDSL